MKAELTERWFDSRDLHCLHLQGCYHTGWRHTSLNKCGRMRRTKLFLNPIANLTANHDSNSCALFSSPTLAVDRLPVVLFCLVLLISIKTLTEMISGVFLKHRFMETNGMLDWSDDTSYTQTHFFHLVPKSVWSTQLQSEEKPFWSLKVNSSSTGTRFMWTAPLFHRPHRHLLPEPTSLSSSDEPIQITCFHPTLGDVVTQCQTIATTFCEASPSPSNISGGLLLCAALNTHTHKHHHGWTCLISTPL